MGLLIHAALVAWAVAAVVVLAIVGLAVTYRRRRRVVYHDRAVELRQHAAFQSENIPQLETAARDARARAVEARQRAERLEHEAQEKESALERARARVEGTVREADRIDPGVRHRAHGYSPSLPGGPGAAPEAGAEDAEIPDGPSHRRVDEPG